MEQYVHRVQYYETDKMGITHHSNYIRWMEEARIDYLDKIGWGYTVLEAHGLACPVIGVEGGYKKPTTFHDLISIQVSIAAYKGVRLTISYTMHNTQTGQLVFTGQSQHCFTGTSGAPVRLEREFPEFHAVLCHAVKAP